MKRLSILFLSLTLLLFSICPKAVLADSSAESNIVYYPVGSYVVTTLHIEPSVSRSSNKTASKTSTAYNPSGAKLYSLTVTGTFSINNGVSVTCTSVSYSKSIFHSLWSLTSASTSRNNSSTTKASATATGYFKSTIGETQSLSPTVYCDKNGNIS